MAKDFKKHNLGLYVTFAIVVLAAHYIIDLKVFSKWQEHLPFLKELTISLFFISLVLLASRIILRLIHKNAEYEGDRYNLFRIVKFLTVVCIFIIVIAFLFQNLVAAAVSFGLISLVLGFALQAPITSFIAWLYIVFRRPFQVGNRIQIGNLRGDVLEIGYIDTLILEVKGDYLGNDRNSGRTIRFPNSIILTAEIINYSGAQDPFIWNEMAMQVAYTSEMPFVEECLIKAAKDDFVERFPKLKDKPEWEPAAYCRVSKYAWMEVVIQYPVEPTDTTGRRNRILRRALPVLNANPDKVQFPEGSMR